jgi:sulfite reductase beta subunit-like hemoprotein
MTEPAANLAAVEAGLIPLTDQEQFKQEKNAMDVIHDIYRYAKIGVNAISEPDFERMKWYGVYRQKPRDGGYFMMRTKIPGGQINGEQAKVLSQIVDRYAHGFCDITTRQTIQFHWLRIEDVPAIFSRLAEVGMTTSGACGDDTRNVVGCPVAGIDPDEVLDATPQLREISRNLTDNREFSNLPRKFKISASGCCIRCAQPDINCTGFFGLKRVVDGVEETGYGVMLGGGLSSAPHLAQMLPFFIKPDQAWPVAKAVAGIFRDEGYRLKRNHARFKFLMADWGVEKMAAAVQARVDFPLEAHTGIPELRDQEADHLGIHAQKQAGLFWVGVSFSGGRIHNGLLGRVGELALKYCAAGQDAIRLTNKQNLLIINVPEANLPGLKNELDSLGLVYQPSNFRMGCVSCTGIEFCNLAVAETKNRMVKMVEQLELQSGWYKGKIRIHFSGCPSSCGQHQIADIGFRGGRTKVGGEQVDAYDCFVGGRLGANRRFGELLKGKVLAKDVHLFVEKLLRVYDAKKLEGEPFAQFCDRVPKAEILAALES